MSDVFFSSFEVSCSRADSNSADAWPVLINHIPVSALPLILCTDSATRLLTWGVCVIRWGLLCGEGHVLLTDAALPIFGLRCTG